MALTETQMEFYGAILINKREDIQFKILENVSFKICLEAMFIEINLKKSQ